MRVLLVNSHGVDVAAGGAERYVADLASGLAARGMLAGVVAAFPPERGDSSLVLHRSDWRRSRARRARNHLGDLVSSPSSALVRAISAFRPDLVHTNNLPGITSAIWEVCRSLGVPVVHTVHDYYLLCPRVTLTRRDGRPCCPHARLCDLRRRRLARWAAAVAGVIGVSQYALDRHRSIFARAEPTVIRHPRPLLAAQAEPPRKLRTLGYLGSLEVQKGVAVLLEAVPELTALGMSLRIAGDGRLRPIVEAVAAKEAGVQYVGHVADAEKQAFLASCDAGVIPSLWPEPGGPPYVMLEWLAAARPVLASGRGGLAEAVRNVAGSVVFEPTRSGVVRAVEQLARPSTWSAATAAVSRPMPDDGDRWLDEHVDAYERARRPV